MVLRSLPSEPLFRSSEPFLGVWGPLTNPDTKSPQATCKQEVYQVFVSSTMCVAAVFEASGGLVHHST